MLQGASLSYLNRLIVQIYEVQTTSEAEKMINIGVDHIGSVILSETSWKVAEIKETIHLIQSTAHARSSLIPLFSNVDSILRVLDFYSPDIIHFCENITGLRNGNRTVENLIKNQERIKQNFPEVLLMRSIPIVHAGEKNTIPTLEMARIFEPLSDYFLTDTCLVNSSKTGPIQQPVNGFIGITGRLCDWDIAVKLVEQTTIPVILGGGISPNNVYTAIKQVRPAGVDSCTETNAVDSKGHPVRFKKDVEKVKQLVYEVRRAEQEIQ